MTTEIYRGFTIKSHAKGGYVVLDEKGDTFSSQPSLEFAYKIVDEEKRKRASTGVK